VIVTGGLVSRAGAAKDTGNGEGPQAPNH
jgi:hypothetical protein